MSHGAHESSAGRSVPCHRSAKASGSEEDAAQHISRRLLGAVGRGRLDRFLFVAFAHADDLPSFFESEIALEFRRGPCRETPVEVGW